MRAYQKWEVKKGMRKDAVTYGDLSPVIDAINRRPHGSRFVLGIDGLSRSGKTTLSRYLESSLLAMKENVFTFHMDDHIVERQKRYETGHESWYEYYAIQWDVSYLRENLFVKLRNHDGISLTFYDETLDEQVLKSVQLPGDCIVIVEGVFLQRPEWREFLDYCIYIDCPRQTRFARERTDTQTKLEKFKNRYWKAEDYYVQRVQPLDRADLVVVS